MGNEHLFGYFKVLMDRQGKYHDHKEVTVWAALVLYLILCAATLRTLVLKSSPVVGFIIIFIFLFISVILVNLYIRKQLELKDIAGSQVAAATYYMTMIVTDGSIGEEFTTIEQNSNTQIQSPHVLPGSFIKKANWLNTQGRGAQVTTRLFIYGLLWTVWFFTVLFKAVQYFG